MSIILFFCWIIFNGKISAEIVLLGLAMTALVYAFMYKFLGWSVKKDLIILKMSWFGISYLGLLIVEIIKATIATIAVTFNEKIEIEPVIVEFDVDLKSELLRVLLANSITMTPGTITVSLIDSHYKVHALDETFAVNIDKSVFVEKLLKADKYLEGLRSEERSK